MIGHQAELPRKLVPKASNATIFLAGTSVLPTSQNQHISFAIIAYNAYSHGDAAEANADQSKAGVHQSSKSRVATITCLLALCSGDGLNAGQATPAYICSAYTLYRLISSTDHALARLRGKLKATGVSRARGQMISVCPMTR